MKKIVLAGTMRLVKTYGTRDSEGYMLKPTIYTVVSAGQMIEVDAAQIEGAESLFRDPSTGELGGTFIDVRPTNGPSEFIPTPPPEGGYGSGYGGGFEDAPDDGHAYVRQGGQWVRLSAATA